MRTLFATPLYEAILDDAELLDELAHSIRTLAEDDEAGKNWSRDKDYKGYTSYASLDDLPVRDPVFADLKTVLTRHARAFAKDLGWAVKPKLDSIWVNLMRRGDIMERISTPTPSYPAQFMSICRERREKFGSRIHASR